MTRYLVVYTTGKSITDEDGKIYYVKTRKKEEFKEIIGLIHKMGYTLLNKSITRGVR